MSSSDHSSDFDKQTPRGARIPTLTDLVDFDSTIPIQKTPRISSWDELTEGDTEHGADLPVEPASSLNEAHEAEDMISNPEVTARDPSGTNLSTIDGSQESSITVGSQSNVSEKENPRQSFGNVKTATPNKDFTVEMTQKPDTQTGSDSSDPQTRSNVNAQGSSVDSASTFKANIETNVSLDFSAYDIVEELANLTADANPEATTDSQLIREPTAPSAPPIDEEQIEQLADRILDTLAPVFREAIASALQEILFSPNKR